MESFMPSDDGSDNEVASFATRTRVAPASAPAPSRSLAIAATNDDSTVTSPSASTAAAMSNVSATAAVPVTPASKPEDAIITSPQSVISPSSSMPAAHSSITSSRTQSPFLSGSIAVGIPPRYRPPATLVLPSRLRTPPVQTTADDGERILTHSRRGSLLPNASLVLSSLEYVRQSRTSSPFGSNVVSAAPSVHASRASSPVPSARAVAQALLNSSGSTPASRRASFSTGSMLPFVMLSGSSQRASGTYRFTSPPSQNASMDDGSSNVAATLTAVTDLLRTVADQERLTPAEQAALRKEAYARIDIALLPPEAALAAAAAAASTPSSFSNHTSRRGSLSLGAGASLLSPDHHQNHHRRQTMPSSLRLAEALSPSSTSAQERGRIIDGLVQTVAATAPTSSARHITDLNIAAAPSPTMGALSTHQLHGKILSPSNRNSASGSPVGGSTPVAINASADSSPLQGSLSRVESCRDNEVVVAAPAAAAVLPSNEELKSLFSGQFTPEVDERDAAPEINSKRASGIVHPTAAAAAASSSSSSSRTILDHLESEASAALISLEQRDHRLHQLFPTDRDRDSSNIHSDLVGSLSHSRNSSLDAPVSRSSSISSVESIPYTHRRRSGQLSQQRSRRWSGGSSSGSSELDPVLAADLLTTTPPPRSTLAAIIDRDDENAASPLSPQQRSRADRRGVVEGSIQIGNFNSTSPPSNPTTNNESSNTTAAPTATAATAAPVLSAGARAVRQLRSVLRRVQPQQYQQPTQQQPAETVVAITEETRLQSTSRVVDISSVEDALAIATVEAVTRSKQQQLEEAQTIAGGVNAVAAAEAPTDTSFATSKPSVDVAAAEDEMKCSDEPEPFPLTVKVAAASVAVLTAHFADTPVQEYQQKSSEHVEGDTHAHIFEDVSQFPDSRAATSDVVFAAAGHVKPSEPKAPASNEETTVEHHHDDQPQQAMSEAEADNDITTTTGLERPIAESRGDLEIAPEKSILTKSRDQFAQPTYSDAPLTEELPPQSSDMEELHEENDAVVLPAAAQPPAFVAALTIETDDHPRGNDEIVLSAVLADLDRTLFVRGLDEDFSSLDQDQMDLSQLDEQVAQLEQELRDEQALREQVRRRRAGATVALPEQSLGRAVVSQKAAVPVLFSGSSKQPVLLYVGKCEVRHGKTATVVLRMCVRQHDNVQQLAHVLLSHLRISSSKDLISAVGGLIQRKIAAFVGALVHERARKARQLRELRMRMSAAEYIEHHTSCRMMWQSKKSRIQPPLRSRISSPPAQRASRPRTRQLTAVTTLPPATAPVAVLSPPAVRSALSPSAARPLASYTSLHERERSPTRNMLRLTC